MQGQEVLGRTFCTAAAGNLQKILLVTSVLGTATQVNRMP